MIVIKNVFTVEARISKVQSSKDGKYFFSNLCIKRSDKKEEREYASFILPNNVIGKVGAGDIVKITGKLTETEAVKNGITYNNKSIRDIVSFILVEKAETVKCDFKDNTALKLNKQK